MVRQRTEHGQASAPDCIPHECCLIKDTGGYVIMIPGDCNSIPDARGQAVAVDPSDIADLEAMR